MREYAKKPESQSRTLDSNPKASRQVPITDILQAYKNETLGRQPVQRESMEDEELLQAKTSGQAPASAILQRYKESIQRYAPEEEDELLQGKFDTAQCKEIGGDELLQGKFDSTFTTEQEPVQQEEKPNNTGLPDNLKTGIEYLSGYSMDDVKVHYNSSKPTQLQALAYTQGTDIHIAPGQEQHLAHEGWHVAQQKQGRVQPTIQLQGINVNDDEDLEKEANEMGYAVLQMYYHRVNEQKKTQKHVNILQTEQAKSLQAIVNNQQPIQRRLMVKEINITDEWVPKFGLEVVVNHIYDLMLQDDTVKANAEFLAIFQAKQDKIKIELTKWIENKPGDKSTPDKSHPVFGRKQQNRSYNNLYDLARALLGWVEAKPMRHAEKRLAEDIYQNPFLDAVLNGLCIKLFYKIINLEAEGLVTHEKQELILSELQKGFSIAKGTFNAQHKWVADEASGSQIKLGHYQRYHRETSRRETDPRIDHNVPDDQLEVLRNPYAYSLKDKVILFHDLMEYFGQHQSWNPKTAGEGLLPVETTADTSVTTAVDDSGERSDSISISDGTTHAERQRARGMGLTSASRDEDAPSTILARSLKLPVWAGQSMTTVRMMKLAQWVGASNLENSALALSIFAYWRKDYDHRSDFAYHTLFEVLDVAKNFGVFYIMHKDLHEHPVINIGVVLKELRVKYSDLVQKTKDLATRANGLAIGEPLRSQVAQLFQKIKDMDNQVNQAYSFITSSEHKEIDQIKLNLNTVVILLENAVQKQKEIIKILDSIPILP
ncbi:MAG: DUF4157 domain-containing protein [Dysgonamonadaceae bacterium]|jgi:hypothetical protein|nr:DUF4157 domain-containing protein [Dysgonamonadaceae bacterium]